MSDEVKEMIYNAANLIFISAVLFIALMFFGLRSEYAAQASDRLVSEQRIVMQNQFKGFDLAQVTGYDVMSAITAYSSEVPVYVTGAYNYVDTTVIQNRLYSKTTRVSNPDWFKMSLAVDPILDASGMQSTYRKESVYYAILTYDSDEPKQLARDLELDTSAGTPNIAGRSAGSMNTSIANKLIWLNSKYNAVRPNGANGYTVSGILFICIDAQGAPVAQYSQVSIY